MKIAILIFALLYVLAGCTKVDQYPTLSHSGKNIVAYRLNGRAIVISGHLVHPSGMGIYLGPDWGVEYTNGSNYFGIYASDNTGMNNLGIQIKFDSTTGTYPIYMDPTVVYPSITGAFYNTPSSGTNLHFFQTDNSHTGYVHVTYYDGDIIAGTFSFDAVDSGQVCHITDGIFDIASQ